MKKLPIIIDYCSEEIRVLAFRKSFIGKFYEEAKKYIFESSDFNEQLVEICDFVREAYPENLGIYINVPSQQVLLREFTLPFFDKKKVKELLPYELESLLPYDLNDIVYDYKIGADLTSNSSHIKVAAVKKSLIETIAAVFFDNNLELSGIYVVEDALFAIATLSEYDNYILYYFADNHSWILPVINRTSMPARVVAYGYNVLLRWLNDRWKSDYQESQSLLYAVEPDQKKVDYGYFKKNFSLSKPETNRLIETIALFNDSIHNEIDRSMDTGNTREQVTRIMVATDHHNRNFIERAIAVRSAVPVFSFPYDATLLKQFGGEYMVALGGAMAVSKGGYFNLFKGDIRKKLKIKKESRWGIKVALLIGILFFIASFVMDFMHFRANIKALQKMRTDVYREYFGHEPDNEFSPAEQAKKSFQKEEKNTEIQMKFLSRPKLMTLLSSINHSLALDLNIEIESLQYSNDQFTVVGSTLNFTELDKIKNGFKNNKAFKNVESRDERSMPGKNGENRVRFNLILTPVPLELE